MSAAGIVAACIVGGVALIAFVVGTVTLILGAIDEQPDEWRKP